ncbi:MAG TPA: TlpA disulfide reductase family protein [Dehalococcoidales bacterium]
MKYARMAIVSIMMLVLVFSASACSPSSGNSSTALGRVTDYRTAKLQLLLKNEPAPDFQLQMPDGTTLFLSDLRGKVVLLNFWGVNCPYCVVEMPYLQKAHDELAADGVVILGINTGEPEKTVSKFVTSKKLSFPIILDPDVYASILYKVQYLPTTYLIDKTGNIQITKIGAFKDVNEVIGALKTLLQ